MESSKAVQWGIWSVVQWDKVEVGRRVAYSVGERAWKMVVSQVAAWGTHSAERKVEHWGTI
jgi:hypothetical protein